MPAAAASLRTNGSLPAPSDSTTIRLQSLQLARSILQQEAAALLQISDQLDSTFTTAVDALRECLGSVIVTGIGKAGLIGQKITATLASTGTPSHFLHPAEAIHGDLGRIQPRDVLLVLSFSGETEEITRLLPSLREMRCFRIAITRSEDSALGRDVDCVLALGPLQEADPLRLAPSTSTTAMLALGDALALAVAQQRRFRPHDFARLHPGGSLGRKLTPVEVAMRPLVQCRVARDQQTVRDVLVTVGQPGRRTGAIMLTDASGKLTGIFTDSDLARLFEERRELALDGPVADVMCDSPTTISAGTLLPRAVEILASRKISELPVIDASGRPLGIIDITDVVISDASADGPQGALQSVPPTLAFENVIATKVK